MRYVTKIVTAFCASVLIVAVSLLVFYGCVFEHDFSELWTYDTEFHWHKSDCKHKDEISGKQAHDGAHCTVCGYVDESLATPGLKISYIVDENGVPDSYACVDGMDFANDKIENGKLVIPSFADGVEIKYIKDRAFGASGAIEYEVDEIILPSTLNQIGEYAFNGTTYYHDPDNWENGVLYIGDCLIKINPDAAEKIDVKEGTRLIADLAFDLTWYNKIPQQTEINLPESLTCIGNKAFYNCNKMECLTLRKNVCYLGKSIFSDDCKIKSVKFEKITDDWYCYSPPDGGAIWSPGSGVVLLPSTGGGKGKLPKRRLKDPAEAAEILKSGSYKYRDGWDIYGRPDRSR